MDLREFVKETLTEILAGVREAQDQLAEAGNVHGAINPTWNDQQDLPSHVQTVKFDVAVTAGDQTTMGGKAGIKVWSIELGGKAEEHTQNKSVSRISFSVPILPTTTTVQGVVKPVRAPKRAKKP